MKKYINTKKIISIFTILFLFLTLTSNFQGVNASEDRKIYDIIEVTDFHGALTDASDNPVAAVLADRISKIEKNNHKRTLIIGGGDLYQGSATSNILRGTPVADVMSKIGMEVTALGNHEFDWGLDTITDKTMTNSSYSIVCSNLYNKNTGERVFEPYKIIKKSKVRIAIIGGISNETPSIVLKDNIKDYEFTDMTTEVNKCAKEIKDNNLADVVIALVHAGDNGDYKTGEIFDCAENLTNVDAVFGGHSHTKVCTRSKNNIPVYIGSAYGKGFIDAKFEITKDNEVKFFEPSIKESYIALDNVNGYKAEKPILNHPVEKIVRKANEEVDPLTSEIIGVNTDKELTRTQTVSPYGSSVLGNWASDVTRQAVNADVGFQNNGGLRINIPVGDITVGTMWRFMPFDNTIYKLNMKKSDIKSLLEQTVMDNGKGIQVSGIKFSYDPNRESLDRVTEITREDGSEISDDEILTVAAPDFLATGGDNFTTFVKCGGDNPENDTHIVVRDKFIEWCKNNKDKNGLNTIPNECISRINLSSNTTKDQDKTSLNVTSVEEKEELKIAA